MGLDISNFRTVFRECSTCMVMHGTPIHYKYKYMIIIIHSTVRVQRAELIWLGLVATVKGTFLNELYLSILRLKAQTQSAYTSGDQTSCKVLTKSTAGPGSAFWVWTHHRLDHPGKHRRSTPQTSTQHYRYPIVWESTPNAHHHHL